MTELYPYAVSERWALGTSVDLDWVMVEQWRQRVGQNKMPGCLPLAVTIEPRGPNSELFTAEQLGELAKDLREDRHPPHEDGFYRIALVGGTRLSSGETEAELFGDVLVRVFPEGTPKKQISDWQSRLDTTEPKRQPIYDHTPVCPSCGILVRYPTVRMTNSGVVECCNECGAPLTDEIGLVGAGDFGVVVKPIEDQPNV